MTEQIAADVASIKTDLRLLRGEFTALNERLYNGGKGDITTMKKDIASLGESRARYGGMAVASAGLCSLCTTFLAIMEIYRLIHGK